MKFHSVGWWGQVVDLGVVQMWHLGCVEGGG